MTADRSRRRPSRRPRPGAARARARLLAAALCLAAAACGRGATGLGGAAPIDPSRLVDLSYPFDSRTIFWPTARPFELTVEAAGHGADGGWYAANTLCGSEHGGTHLDAPYHFAATGLTAERIPLGALVAPAFVIDARAAAGADPDHAVSKEEIEAFEAAHGALPKGAVVVLHTGWGARWPDARAYLGDDTPGDASRLRFPGLSPEGARLLATRRVAGVGIDTASIDPGRSRDFAAHRVLAEADIYNLENLDNVERLPPRGALLVALPMKIAGGSGAPVRVLAILP